MKIFSALAAIHIFCTKNYDPQKINFLIRAWPVCPEVLSDKTKLFKVYGIPYFTFTEFHWEFLALLQKKTSFFIKILLPIFKKNFHQKQLIFVSFGLCKSVLFSFYLLSTSSKMSVGCIDHYFFIIFLFSRKLT